MADATQRFGTRVSYYVQGRPGYPAALIELLRRECGLAQGCAVADVGSGTGILTRLLLEAGARVYAVEPNDEMRAAAESALGAHPGFTSVAAAGEDSGLPDACVDLVTCAQAFHWLDRALARREFARILRPGGSVAIVWNDRRDTASPFLAEYEALLQAFGTDYREVDHRNVSRDMLDAFFGAGAWREERLPHTHSLDYAGLQARLLSTSYVPSALDPRCGPMLQALRVLFMRHAEDGLVHFEYDAKVCWGRIV